MRDLHQLCHVQLLYLPPFSPNPHIAFPRLYQRLFTLTTMESATTLQPLPPSERPGIVRSDNRSKMVHSETHSDYGNIIRDVIIGFADRLTVPFALL
jgi:hypothetical protein